MMFHCTRRTNFSTGYGTWHWAHTFAPSPFGGAATDPCCDVHLSKSLEVAETSGIFTWLDAPPRSLGILRIASGAPTRSRCGERLPGDSPAFIPLYSPAVRCTPTLQRAGNGFRNPS
jgi:hypothetical protein